MRFAKSEIARAQTGVKNYYGTYYPVETIVHRVNDCFRSRPYWTVTFDQWNGSPASDARYKTKREAMAAFNAHVKGED